jgi:hypothetical protein
VTIGRCIIGNVLESAVGAKSGQLRVIGRNGGGDEGHPEKGVEERWRSTTGVGGRQGHHALGVAWRLRAAGRAIDRVDVLRGTWA